MDWSFEKAERLFLNQLNGELVNIDKYGFSREFEFEVFGVTYKIIWYKNQSTLIQNGLHVMFHKASLSNTWPSPAGSKMKVQFYDGNNNTVAVLPIEYYSERES